MQYNFEWDIKKANQNRKKHNVSFELATTIFSDPRALSLYDNEHSNSIEDRWITLGISGNEYLLVVVHTYNEINDKVARIRIISARKATKREIVQYQGE